LKGEHIAEEFQDLVEKYVARTFARKTTHHAPMPAARSA